MIIKHSRPRLSVEGAFQNVVFSIIASAMCKGGDAGARLSAAIAKLRPTVKGALERSDPKGDAQKAPNQNNDSNRGDITKWAVRGFVAHDFFGILWREVDKI